jgi:hypothetical protein
VTRHLLCSVAHVYFSDLIFDLSVIRDYTWFDLRGGRPDTLATGRDVCVANGMLIICRGVAALQSFSITVFQLQTCCHFMLFISVTFVWSECIGRGKNRNKRIQTGPSTAVTV